MLFNRLCRVEIKNIHTGLVSIFDQSLRIEFEYSKSIDQSEATSSGWVRIHNLSQDTVKNFGGARFSQVTVYTGYESDPNSFGVLFRADVTNIKYQKDKGTITTIELSNSFTDLVVGQKIANTLPENVTRKEVIDSILDIVWKGKATEVVVNSKTLQIPYPYGYVAHGTKKSVLDEFCRANDIQWSILNKADGDVLYLESRVQDGTASYPDKQSIVLNSDTGLIGLPYLDMEKITKNMDDSLGEGEFELNAKPKYNKDGTLDDKPRKKKKVAVYNVSCKALIDSSVNPQTLIRIETEEGSTDGLYRVQDAKFSGDTFGNDWYMSLNLRNGNETASVATTGQTKTAAKKPSAGSVPKNSADYRPMAERQYSRNGYTNGQKSTLFAQLEQESGFDPNAVSPTGVRGISQFTTATAKQYGVIFGDSAQAVESQIAGQAKFMKDLYNQFDGNMDKALAGYNAGGAYVAKASQEYGEAWLENIGNVFVNIKGVPTKLSPAKVIEVQNYVPSVNAKATKYTF